MNRFKNLKININSLAICKSKITHTILKILKYFYKWTRKTSLSSNRYQNYPRKIFTWNSNAFINYPCIKFKKHLHDKYFVITEIIYFLLFTSVHINFLPFPKYPLLLSTEYKKEYSKLKFIIDFQLEISHFWLISGMSGYLENISRISRTRWS